VLKTQSELFSKTSCIFFFPSDFSCEEIEKEQNKPRVKEIEVLWRERE